MSRSKQGEGTRKKMKSKGMKVDIKKIIRRMMDALLKKILDEEPFDLAAQRRRKQLLAALVPNEILKGSYFERKFVTEFGGTWEDLAVVVARHKGGNAERGVDITGKVRSGRMRRIDEILRSLDRKGEKKRRKPDWRRELSYIMAGKGRPAEETVTCDIYFEDRKSGKGKKKYAFELKAPLPNKDQTRESKRKLLILHSMSPRKVNAAYFALPYNPFGRRQDYKWGYAEKWFNMKEDSVVLMEDEFWDKIGPRKTYSVILEAARELGRTYRKRISNQYLQEGKK